MNENLVKMIILVIYNKFKTFFLIFLGIFRRALCFRKRANSASDRDEVLHVVTSESPKKKNEVNHVFLSSKGKLFSFAFFSNYETGMTGILVHGMVTLNSNQKSLKCLINDNIFILDQSRNTLKSTGKN